MRILQRIPRHEAIPKYYGVVAYDPPNAETICAPLGLNLILAAGCFLVYWVQIAAAKWLVHHYPRERR